jgi:cytosine/adenosine deaminase-related metal-dependent hydrolase
MDKKLLLELRRKLLTVVDNRHSTKEDLVAVIEEVSKKMHQLHIAEKLDEQIAILEVEGKTYKALCELSDLRASRAHLQEVMESNAGE